MRISAKIFLLVIVLSLIAGSASAQKPETKPSSAKVPTVGEILDKYVKALGGREAIQKIKSRTSKGTVEIVGMSVPGTFELYAAPDARSYSKTTLTGLGDFVEGTDGKTAWAVNPIQGSRDKAGVELLQAKLINDFYRDIRLDKLYQKIEVKGSEKVGDKQAYVLTATAEGVPAETWYFDVQSGLMLRMDMTVASPEGNVPMSIFYEDMRAVDGVSVPFKIRSQAPTHAMVLTVTEIKNGLQVDESKFAKPKQ